MQWRIVLALAALAPAIALALRDGRISEAELADLGDRLVGALAGLLAPKP